MKKAITILAILIVLVGAVFAEDHTIRIKADVTSVIPVFGLKYNTSVTNSTSLITEGENAGQYSNSYTAAGNYVVAAGAAIANTDALDAGIKLDKGGDVYFWAELLNPAKQKKGYTLVFTDGVFNVTKNSGTAATITPTITTDNLNTTTNNGFAVTAGANNATVRVVFDGKQVVNADSIDLARAKYTYTGLPEIDMPAGTENYWYADVTLTITADAN